MCSAACRRRLERAAKTPSNGRKSAYPRRVTHSLILGKQGGLSTRCQAAHAQPQRAWRQAAALPAASGSPGSSAFSYPPLIAPLLVRSCSGAPRLAGSMSPIRSGSGGRAGTGARRQRSR